MIFLGLGFPVACYGQKDERNASWWSTFCIKKLPGGWETAIAVKHVLNKDSLGAVAPYTFLDQHYLMFFPGKI